MNHCRLIYRSIATNSEMRNEEIAVLTDKAAKNNREAGITGLLILTGDQFLQVLEGESGKVNALFQKICQDPRHREIELIEYEEPADSYFDDWNMRLVDLFDLPLEKRRLFMAKYETTDDAVKIPRKPGLIFSLLLDARAVCLGLPVIATADG